MWFLKADIWKRIDAFCAETEQQHDYYYNYGIFLLIKYLLTLPGKLGGDTGITAIDFPEYSSYKSWIIFEPTPPNPS